MIEKIKSQQLRDSVNYKNHYNQRYFEHPSFAELHKNRELSEERLKNIAQKYNYRTLNLKNSKSLKDVVNTLRDFKHGMP